VISSAIFCEDLVTLNFLLRDFKVYSGALRRLNAKGEETRVLEFKYVPIDRRIAFLTASSKLVEVDCIDAILSKYRREALRAWSIVSEESGIPLLNLDSLLWLPLRGPDSLLARGLVGEAREKYAENLYRYSRGEIPLDFARKIARALLQLKPRTRC